MSYPLVFDNPENITELLERGFDSRELLVVGDLMLDRYIYGDIRRVSPEAPVPVVRYLRQTESPGGGANVALNAASLGLRVHLAGYVGADDDGERLLSLLNK